jgi:hypothetical protein
MKNIGMKKPRRSVVLRRGLAWMIADLGDR